MNGSTVDILTVIVYFVVILIVGFWTGRGKQDTAAHYFISKGMLPWWAMGAAYVATGLNSEQLIGMNGMAYRIGLPIANSYLPGVIIYGALIFCFFPLYLRNNIFTMPQYLGQRFNMQCQNIFSVLLLLSYIFLSLAVVLYGGAKLFEGVYGVPVWLGVLILGIVSGIYTMYGGMFSMINTSVVQFILMFIAGGVLFVLGYMALPNGWNDIVVHAPCGFHMMKPTNYPIMPWHAAIINIFGLHLFYSCINQALVQRGFGGKTEWDVKMAIIFATGFVLLRPFIEFIPGMIARALAFTGHEEFIISAEQIDNVFPIMIANLVPVGLKGLMFVGIIAASMSTISAFLNSISTLFTYDVYKKWINKNTTDKKLVKVGVISTFVLIVFSVLYAPLIEKLGGIFIYFQSTTAYLAVPIATCFLFGIFWKRTTPAAALTIMIIGIPLGILINLSIIPFLFSEEVIAKYSLTNFYVSCGITQIVCSIIIIGVSLCTKPRITSEIISLTWNNKFLRLPENEQKRPIWQSVWFWYSVMIIIYCIFFYMWW